VQAPTFTGQGSMDTILEDDYSIAELQLWTTEQNMPRFSNPPSVGLINQSSEPQAEMTVPTQTPCQYPSSMYSWDDDIRSEWTQD